MREGITVKVRGIRMLLQAANELRQRPRDQAGICVAHGPSGYGKTTAIAYSVNQRIVDGIHVRALRSWTPSSMLEAILAELGLPAVKPCARAVHEIVRRLMETSRSIFIDEADYLTNRGWLLDTLRDIHDLSSAPIILVGMDRFRQECEKAEQFAGRIYRDVAFGPADDSDARMLADELCDRAKIADDLVLDLLHQTKGSIRRLRHQLTDVEAFAHRQKLATIRLADWQEATRKRPVKVVPLNVAAAPGAE